MRSVMKVEQLMGWELVGETKVARENIHIPLWASQIILSDLESNLGYHAGEIILDANQ
jgi:hypothetical protein